MEASPVVAGAVVTPDPSGGAGPPGLGRTEVVVRRVLSGEQMERRALVIEAATALADAGGYDAVVMKAVAERSGVALATIYRWFASKDHLLTEVLLTWGGDVSDELAADPPRGEDPVARVGEALRRVTAIAASRPRLAGAVVSAVLAVEATALEARDDFHRMMSSWIDIALGADEIADRDAVVETLELVVFASFIGLVTGRASVEDAGRQLETAAHLLIRS